MIEPAPPHAATLSSLSDDVICLTFGFLSVEDASSFARTCSKYWSIAQSHQLFGRYAYTIDAHRHYDVAIPVRHGLRRLEIAGGPVDVARILAEISAAAVNTQYSVCVLLPVLCARACQNPSSCRAESFARITVHMKFNSWSMSLLLQISSLVISAPPDCPRPLCCAGTALCKEIRKLKPSLTSLTLNLYTDPRNDPLLFDAVKHLSNLGQLRFYITGLGGEVPDSIRRLSKLTELVISGCGLTEFPKVLCDMTGLRALTFALNDRFTRQLALPAAIGRWRNITRLDLSRCGLASLPISLDMLGDTLRELRISGNPRLLELPAAFSALTRVTCLDVSNLPAIVSKPDPEAVGSLPWLCDHMTQLEALEVNSCALQQVWCMVMPCVVSRVRSWGDVFMHTLRACHGRRCLDGSA